MSGEVRAEITLDDAHLREHHEEWIAAVGKGWRTQRIMIRVFAALAVAIGVGVALGLPGRFAGLALGLAGIAAFEAWQARRRRGAWLAFQRTLDWYGRTMSVVLRDGVLVQEKAFAGDPRYERTGEILATPNGWLVRYVAPEGIAAPDAVSKTHASVYLPLRSLRPAIGREEFERRLAAGPGRKQE